MLLGFWNFFRIPKTLEEWCRSCDIYERTGAAVDCVHCMFEEFSQTKIEEPLLWEPKVEKPRQGETVRQEDGE